MHTNNHASCTQGINKHDDLCICFKGSLALVGWEAVFHGIVYSQGEAVTGIQKCCFDEIIMEAMVDMCSLHWLLLLRAFLE